MINYSLSENGFISLKVYDILGKEVAALVNQNQDAGRYSVNFNGSKSASGIYIYKIEARSGKSVSFIETRRMLLVK